MKERGNFGSKLGIVLATAGSAVGLGNVWRFPYMAGENGGAAFILIYIACILVLGVPGMDARKTSTPGVSRSFANSRSTPRFSALSL